jgi:hypothetical protein
VAEGREELLEAGQEQGEEGNGRMNAKKRREEEGKR